MNDPVQAWREYRASHGLGKSIPDVLMLADALCAEVERLRAAVDSADRITNWAWRELAEARTLISEVAESLPWDRSRPDVMRKVFAYTAALTEEGR